MWPANTSLVDLLNNYGVHSQLNLLILSPTPLRCEKDNDFGFDEPNSQFSEDSVNESLSDVGDESDDNVNETPIVSNHPVMNFMNDIGDEGDDDIVDIQDKIHLDFWNESENKIRLGMLFENKDQQNREFKVCESKSSFWIAKCKSLGGEEGSSNIDPYTLKCALYVRAMKKKNHHMWKITRNDNRSLNSATIAFYIIHSIEKDIAYPLKHIQADIKNILNVDVSYWKAWHVTLQSYPSTLQLCKLQILILS
uniref:Uncharacterized protein n=1 Tax=Lactuca sativa TaxID=4236 RepID=A0A9R1XXI7_LACSA|nr:hypothetical protein LSAT_V11C100029420 [Lactuca sativa]